MTASTCLNTLHDVVVHVQQQTSGRHMSTQLASDASRNHALQQSMQLIITLQANSVCRNTVSASCTASNN